MPEARPAAQPKPAQAADSARHITDEHLMPGLVPQIVDTFRRPRKHFTTRGVARAQDVSMTVVHTALFRDIYERLDCLEGKGRPTVRQQLHLIRGGKAA